LWQFEPAPGSHEQRVIADFLDRETARIDALVAKKERLIELLREKRTAIISAAVTGKIDLRQQNPSRPVPAFL
jgi:type I restriction enzyme S subunit